MEFSKHNFFLQIQGIKSMVPDYEIKKNNPLRAAQRLQIYLPVVFFIKNGLMNVAWPMYDIQENFLA